MVSFAVGWFIDNEILIYLALRSSKSVSSLKLMLSSDETSNHTADTTQLPHATPRKVYKNSKKEKCPSSTYLFIHYKRNFGRRLLSWVDPRNVSVKTMPAQSSQTIGLRFFCWDWDLKIVAWSDPLLTCDEASKLTKIVDGLVGLTPMTMTRVYKVVESDRNKALKNKRYATYSFFLVRRRWYLSETIAY